MISVFVYLFIVVLLGFTEFNKVIMKSGSSTVFHEVLDLVLSSLTSVLLDFTGFLLGFTGFYWVLLS